MDAVKPITGSVLLIQPEREEIRKRFCDAVLEFEIRMRALGMTTKAIVLDNDSVSFCHSATQWGSPLVPTE